MRKALRGVKNVVYQYSPIELKVREATNNDRYLVPASQLADIALATNNYQEYPALFAMLWKRLTDLEHVMHVQKALHVVDYLLRHGAERFISDAKRRARDIAALQKYKHYNEHNEDDAKEARARAKAVYALLMDDQLLAAERAKSARLAAEGRLAGMGTYSATYGGYGGGASGAGGGERYRGEADSYAPAPVRRPVAAPASHTSASAAYAASAASAAPTSHRPPPSTVSTGKSVALRRRSVDEDPFENPVIPSVALGGAGAAAQTDSPQQKQRSRKHRKQPQEQEEEEEEEEEDEEAAAKRTKKEKKRKKKEEEARRAAAAAAAEQQQLQQSHSRSSSARPTSDPFDLSNFAADAPSSKAGGDFDILTGFSSGPAVNGSGGGAFGEQALEDLFASATLSEEQVSDPAFYANNNNNTSSPLSGNPFQSSPEPGSTSPAHKESVVSPTNQLVNLTDLTSSPPAHEKKKSMDGGVSMSMMRSIQPLGSPVKTPGGAAGSAASSSANSSSSFGGDIFSDLANKKRSHVPLGALPELAASLPPSMPPPSMGGAAHGTGMMGPGGYPHGMAGGYGAAPSPHMAAPGMYPGLGQMGGPGAMRPPPQQSPTYGAGPGGMHPSPQMGGYGMQGPAYPHHSPHYGGHGPMMSPHHPHPGLTLFDAPSGNQQQPLALMPPGMGSAGAYGSGPGPNAPSPYAMPAPSPGAMTFTTMRQGPTAAQQGGGGAFIFDVRAAPPTR